MTGATSMDSMDGVRLDFEGGFVPNANDEAGYHYYLEQTYGAGMADVVRQPPPSVGDDLDPSESLTEHEGAEIEERI